VYENQNSDNYYKYNGLPKNYHKFFTLKFKNY